MASGKRPIHPGQVAATLTIKIVAAQLGLAENEVYKLFGSNLKVDKSMAQRLANVYGQTKDYWLDLQSKYDRYYVDDDDDEICLQA